MSVDAESPPAAQSISNGIELCAAWQTIAGSRLRVVSAIAPGFFPSQMNRAADHGGDKVLEVIPARRLGEPGDMAAAAVYLASRAGDYVVGTCLTVDGGIAEASLAKDFPSATGE